MSVEQDQQLWAALVEAEKEHRRRKAEFYQNAHDRTGVLQTALHGQPWQVTTALDYLRAFSSDAPELVPRLVELCLSTHSALAARQAIAAIPRDQLWPILTPVIDVQMQTTDPDDLRRLAELLAHLQAWPMLKNLVSRAEEIDDPDARELADDFSSKYAPCWAATPGSGPNP
jgi:hypothetical protein